MKKFIQILVIGIIVFFGAYGVSEAALLDPVEVLMEYDLFLQEDQLNDSFTKLMDGLTLYSDSSNNIYLDLFDTLKKYSQAKQLSWQRHDLAKIAWAIKAFDQQMHQQRGYEFTNQLRTGYELEVIHEHGNNKPDTYLYKNPFKHDIDGDGAVDLYDEDEYMRQYVEAQLGVTGPHMDGAMNLKAGLNYFGTGYLEDSGLYARQFDLQIPQLNDFTFSLYSPHFTATIGEQQILGLRDYLYYDDPANPDDYNLSGVTLQAPYGIFFALGQETVRDWNEPAQTRDVRWIATGTEGLGFLPVNLYLTEQEIQTPDFHKVGRNVVFALTSDLQFPGVNVSGDLALNDSGDGMYARVKVDGQVEQLSIQSKFEVANHFTPIQPKGDFANTTYIRHFYNGEEYAFPARTERGMEIHGQFQLKPEIQLYGDMQSYLKSRDYTLGLHYQILPELMVRLAGKYDHTAEGILSAEIESSYNQPYGRLYGRKVIGGSGEFEIKAEPVYANRQVTVKGLFGFGMLPYTGQRNTQMGVEVIYHPVDEFTFYAKYTSENMGYGVDLPGHNFTRNGTIEYHLTDSISANVTFENIDFRNANKGYLVEYTLGGIRIEF